MNQRKTLNRKKVSRAKRARAKILGSSSRPRLAVFRSNRFIYAQLIDDSAEKTVVSASSHEASKSVKEKKKIEQAYAVGELIAKKALEKDIKHAVFDRRSYQYHGRVKAVADGARKSGLKI